MKVLLLIGVFVAATSGNPDNSDTTLGSDAGQALNTFKGIRIYHHLRGVYPHYDMTIKTGADAVQIVETRANGEKKELSDENELINQFRLRRYTSDKQSYTITIEGTYIRYI